MTRVSLIVLTTLCVILAGIAYTNAAGQTTAEQRIANLEETVKALSLQVGRLQADTAPQPPLEIPQLNPLAERALLNRMYQVRPAMFVQISCVSVGEATLQCLPTRYNANAPYPDWLD